MREVSYSAKNANRIDIVLFLNGLPVATIETKNLPTGTTFRHAEAQYCKDRSPAGEPLLIYRRGALVHFALDDNNVSMTTRLANGRTHFLPFNRGRDDGAGNPEVRASSRSPISTAGANGARPCSHGLSCSTSSRASCMWNGRRAAGRKPKRRSSRGSTNSMP